MFTLSGYIIIMNPEGCFVAPTSKHHGSPNTEILLVLHIVLNGADEIKRVFSPSSNYFHGGFVWGAESRETGKRYSKYL